MRNFLKPSKGKIALFIILILVLPIFTSRNILSKSCEPTRIPCNFGFDKTCQPCQIYQFRFFGIPSLIDDLVLRNNPVLFGSQTEYKIIVVNLPLNIILIIALSYIAASWIIQIHKNKPTFWKWFFKPRITTILLLFILSAASIYGQLYINCMGCPYNKLIDFSSHLFPILFIFYIILFGIYKFKKW